MTERLTPRQQAFADEFLISSNAKQAYLKAGYKAKSDSVAEVEGSRTLRIPKVKRYLDKRLEEISGPKVMDATEAMERLTKIARGEEYETVYVSSPLGVETKQKESDIKARITAIKEILRRYPQSDNIKELQAKKMELEVELTKRKLEHLDDSAVSDEITFIDDVPEGDSDE